MSPLTTPPGGNRPTTCNLLCADIGGTNSRWAFFRLTGDKPEKNHQITEQGVQLRTGGDGLPPITASETKMRAPIREPDQSPFSAGFHEFSPAGNGSQGLELVAEKWLPTQPQETINHQLRRLYAEGFPLALAETDLAVLAVAGPIQRRGRYSKLPLAGLEVDLDLVEQEFPFRRAVLINDFTAQALAVLAPPGQNAQLILPGRIAPPRPTPTDRGALASTAKVGTGHTDANSTGRQADSIEPNQQTSSQDPVAPLAVIGAGTGLGKALLLPLGVQTFAGSTQAATNSPPPSPLVMPSEGGHADFPFAGGRERDYLEFLLKERGEERISGNTVVSGRGLSYLHHFLSGQKLAPAAVTATFTPDSETLAWAARFYGRTCRNFVLETLAIGGLYIAGGVAAKNPQLLTHPAFAQEFHHSPTMGHLLQKVPVYLISAENSGLWGAAIQARLILHT